MNLADFKFPELTQADLAFPTMGADKELLKEATKRDPQKGIDKFNELFYSGGKFDLQKDVKGTWKEKAFLYAKCLMGSWSPKHEHKELIVGMLFEETLIL